MISYTSAANLGQVADEALRRYSDRPALWIQGKMLTYADLGEISRGIASAVLGHSTVSRRVAVLADRNEVGYAGILGALLAGMAYVPLNPRFSAARIVDILEQADVDAIVCDTRCKTILDSISASLPKRLRVVMCEPGRNLLKAASPDSDTGHRVNDACREDTAYIMFTSGTTGKPKGVPVSHGNALSFLENIRKRVPPQADDRFLQILDLSFDPSLHDLFTCWTVGATLYSVPEGMATMADRFIRDFQITQFSAVASTAALLHAQGRLKPGALGCLRDTIFGGEALPVGVAAAWRKAAPKSTVRNHYGPTEATVAITECVWSDAWEAELTGSVPIGEVFDGQTVRLVDDALQPVELGTPGELLVEGTQVTKGYLNNPEATREKFVILPGSDRQWYRTGDLVERHQDYGLRYRGRVDLQLKVRGFRVEAQEVESQVRAASGSDFAAVVGWPRDAEGLVSGLVAFVVAPKVSENAIIEACRNRMPDYMVPSRVVVLPELPLNANGKVDYAALSRSNALS
jgi:D-alanine--poly(phosphoribitol) ligase subunit 1